MSRLGDAAALAAGASVGLAADEGGNEEAVAGEAECAGRLGGSWQAPLRTATPVRAASVLILRLADNLTSSAANQARVVVDEGAGGAR